MNPGEENAIRVNTHCIGNKKESVTMCHLAKRTIQVIAADEASNEGEVL